LEVQEEALKYKTQNLNIYTILAQNIRPNKFNILFTIYTKEENFNNSLSTTKKVF